VCFALGEGLESQGQQPCQPFVHLLRDDGVWMYRQPAILPIAPDMVGQPNGHRWGARRVPLAQALVRHHKVVEADQEPDPPPLTSAAPGQTPRAAPQGRDEPPQGAIPLGSGHLGVRPPLPGSVRARPWLG
jgi:hypothetical protein